MPLLSAVPLAIVTTYDAYSILPLMLHKIFCAITTSLLPKRPCWRVYKTSLPMTRTP